MSPVREDTEDKLTEADLENLPDDLKQKLKGYVKNVDKRLAAIQAKEAKLSDAPSPESRTTRRSLSDRLSITPSSQPSGSIVSNAIPGQQTTVPRTFFTGSGSSAPRRTLSDRIGGTAPPVAPSLRDRIGNVAPIANVPLVTRMTGTASSVRPLSSRTTTTVTNLVNPTFPDHLPRYSEHHRGYGVGAWVYSHIPNGWWWELLGLSNDAIWRAVVRIERQSYLQRMREGLSEPREWSVQGMFRAHFKRHVDRFPFILDYRDYRTQNPFLPTVPPNELWHRGLFIHEGVDLSEQELSEEDNEWLIGIAQTVHAPVALAGPIHQSIVIPPSQNPSAPVASYPSHPTNYTTTNAPAVTQGSASVPTPITHGSVSPSPYSSASYIGSPPNEEELKEYDNEVKK